jgi:hypothetical protein
MTNRAFTPEEHNRIVDEATFIRELWDRSTFTSRGPLKDFFVQHMLGYTTVTKYNMGDWKDIDWRVIFKQNRLPEIEIYPKDGFESVLEKQIISAPKRAGKVMASIIAEAKHVMETKDNPNYGSCNYSVVRSQEYSTVTKQNLIGVVFWKVIFEPMKDPVVKFGPRRVIPSRMKKDNNG